MIKVSSELNVIFVIINFRCYTYKFLLDRQGGRWGIYSQERDVLEKELCSEPNERLLREVANQVITKGT